MPLTPDDWAHLPYFLAVARSGSLRLAADAAGATHATVDRHLKALERSYGVRLFDRRSTGLTLTPAGRALLPVAEAADQNVTAARRRVSGLDQEAAGLVRLSIPPALAQGVMPPIIAGFCAAYPQIDLSIRVTNRFEDLANAERDVSLRIAFSVDDDVVGRRLLTYSVGTYAAQSYLDRHWGGRGPDGEGLHWIGWAERDAIPDWVKRSAFPKARIRHAVRESTLVADLVEQGMGMSILPHMMMRNRPGVVRVPGTASEPNRSIWLLLHADLRETMRVRLLVDYVAKAFGDLKATLEAA